MKPLNRRREHVEKMSRDAVSGEPTAMFRAAMDHYWGNTGSVDRCKAFDLLSRSYAGSAESARDKVKQYGCDELSEVMEVYDLTLDMETQLAEKRVWNLPSA